MINIKFSIIWDKQFHFLWSSLQSFLYCKIEENGGVGGSGKIGQSKGEFFYLQWPIKQKSGEWLGDIVSVGPHYRGSTKGRGGGIG